MNVKQFLELLEAQEKRPNSSGVEGLEAPAAATTSHDPWALGAPGRPDGDPKRQEYVSGQGISSCLIHNESADQLISININYAIHVSGEWQLRGKVVTSSISVNTFIEELLITSAFGGPNVPNLWSTAPAQAWRSLTQLMLVFFST